MKKIVTLISLFFSLSCFVFSQPNAIISKTKLSLNKETVINENNFELDTKQSEQFYQNILSLFIQQGFIIQENSDVTIVPKLSKISQMESDELFVKLIVSRYRLSILLRGINKNEMVLNTYDCEITGSGHSVNESIFSSIDEIASLSSKDKFNKFIASSKERLFEFQKNKNKSEKIIPPVKKEKDKEKPREEYTGGGKPAQEVPVKPPPPPPDSKWYKVFWDWVSNLNNLIGIITGLATLFLFLITQSKMRRKSIKPKA
jgi:hypothetical protein